MNYRFIDNDTISASVNVSRFQGQSGVEEYHFVVRPTEYGDIKTQLDWTYHAYQKALDSLGLDMPSVVFRRFYCSDLLNQASGLKSHPLSYPANNQDSCAVSWVCQPSLPPIKVVLWAYHIKDPHSPLSKVQEGSSLILKREENSHYWTTGITHLTGNTHYDQTRAIFEKYQSLLKHHRMSLAEHAIRTWFFVQNIDADYKGLVAARREFFAEHGLTPATHFIASTGIEGSHMDVSAKVTMDAYAISGVRPEQIQYLSALDHLSPTHIYGVTFERGTAVSYRDRKHVIISGTASIDHQGNILYPGDINKQLERTVENVTALLQNAHATFQDMAILIVYVRDSSDLAHVRQLLQNRFGDLPLEVLVAPVCRPGWLIEMEGIAILPSSNPTLPSF